jgi:tetratricopeptide (TPR) repeat protein
MPGRARWHRRSSRALLAGALAAAACAPALAQVRPPARAELALPDTGIELTVPVQQALLRLQEEWLQWVTAYYRGNHEAAEAAVTALRGTGEQLGLQRLPELALGASVRAVQSAREGDFERAGWGLAAAEQLDPGRPETAFAAAAVARLEGRLGAALQQHLRGYVRELLDPRLRELWAQQAGLRLLYTLLLAGALCLALQMAVKGEALVLDLWRFARRRLPAALAVAAVPAFLLWPLVLPAGMLWLALYWTILLWGYGSTSERVLLVVLVLLVALAPLAVQTRQRRLAVRLSPPASAMDLLAQRRLTGTLFTDLASLRSMLPESTAVHHLLADLHRLLGQWELARPLYQAVLDAEPQNAAALLGVGAYHFRKGDFGRAAEFFQRAAAADPSSAAANYDLSLAYSEAYQFDESRQALERARQLDDLLLAGWINQPSPDRVVTLEGGLRRGDEIRRELAPAWEVSGSTSSGAPATLGTALAILAGAVGLHLARRRSGYQRPRAAAGWLRRWVGPLVPGLASTEKGAGGRAFLAAAVVTALVVLPLDGRLGYSLPLAYQPGPALPAAIAACGLVAWAAWRVRAALRRG